MTNQTLISHVPIPATNVHAVPGPEDFSTPEAAATAYESDLRKFFGIAPPAFDLQLLGLGVEGHTALTVPGLSCTERDPALGDGRRGSCQAPETLNVDPHRTEPGSKHILPRCWC